MLNICLRKLSQSLTETKKLFIFLKIKLFNFVFKKSSNIFRNSLIRKGETSFVNDKLLSASDLHAGRNYSEKRDWYDQTHDIQVRNYSLLIYIKLKLESKMLHNVYISKFLVFLLFHYPVLQ